MGEAVPLFASLLSLPLASGYAPLNVSPEQQKQRILQALLTITLRIAARQPVLFVVEDLHWVDPTTLEFLSLLVDRRPTARILALFTFRPDFAPPWTGRAHLTPVTLNRLPRGQAAEMTGWVAHGKALPPEVLEQVAAKTDGVPLFVEELTKMVMESGLLQEGEERYELTGPLPLLAIPTTLHDSLMARLDRLAAVKGLAQLGATLGREFSGGLAPTARRWSRDDCPGIVVGDLFEAPDTGGDGESLRSGPHAVPRPGVRRAGGRVSSDPSQSQHRSGPAATLRRGGTVLQYAHAARAAAGQSGGMTRDNERW